VPGSNIHRKDRDQEKKGLGARSAPMRCLRRSPGREWPWRSRTWQGSIDESEKEKVGGRGQLDRLEKWPLREKKKCERARASKIFSRGWEDTCNWNIGKFFGERERATKGKNREYCVEALFFRAGVTAKKGRLSRCGMGANARARKPGQRIGIFSSLLRERKGTRASRILSPCTAKECPIRLGEGPRR